MQSEYSLVKFRETYFKDLPNFFSLYLSFISPLEDKLESHQLVSKYVLGGDEDKKQFDQILEYPGQQFKILNRIKETLIYYSNAVKRSDGWLERAPYQTEELCEIALRWHPSSLQYVREQTLSLRKTAVKNDPDMLKWIRRKENGGLSNKDYLTVCELAVRTKGSSVIQFCSHPHDLPKEEFEKICKIAVSQDGCLVEYIYQPSKELCRIAVSQNPFAIQYIDRPSNSLLTLAFNQTILSFKSYLERNVHKLRYEEILRTFTVGVRQNGLALRYINQYSCNRDDYFNLCKIAVRQDRNAYKFVNSFKGSFTDEQMKEITAQVEP